MLYFGDGIVCGVDSGTGRYDGTAREKLGGGIKGHLLFTTAPGRPMITGGVAPQHIPPVPVDFDFPPVLTTFV
jgi:hypothetical protein